MRIQTEEWQRFIPGVRMYKGKKTLFYNGEILRDEELTPLIYDFKERQSWEVIVVLPGVEVIPEWTFKSCFEVEKVVMSDSVKRIEHSAFEDCESLEFIKFSKNLEYIGLLAFHRCLGLHSVYVPLSCREIDHGAFIGCENLIILNVPQHTQLGQEVIKETLLIESSPFETNEGEYHNVDEVNEWIKRINDLHEYALHRECASIEPNEEVICRLLMEEGSLLYLDYANDIGISPYIHI